MRYALMTVMVMALCVAGEAYGAVGGKAAGKGNAPEPAATETAAAATAPATPSFEGPPSGSMAETHKRLQRLISVDFNNTALPEVFDELSRMTGVQFVPDWEGIHQGHASAWHVKGLRISLRLKDISAYQVLKQVLQATSSALSGFSGRIEPPVFAIDKDGLVRVCPRHGRTSSEGGGLMPIPRLTGAYDVKDLVKAGSTMPDILASVKTATGRMLYYEGYSRIAGTQLVIIQTPDVHAAVTSVLASMRGQKVEDPSDEAVRQQLALTFQEVDLYGCPIEEALDYLRKECALNLNIQWDAIKKAGIDVNAPVTVQPLQNVTLERLMKAVLDCGKSGSARLTSKIEKGVIVISAEAAGPPK